MGLDAAAWGTNDHRDIRTFYPNELAYLKAMKKRYACQFCGTSNYECAGCAEISARIKELDG